MEEEVEEAAQKAGGPLKNLFGGRPKQSQQQARRHTSWPMCQIPSYSLLASPWTNLLSRLAKRKLQNQFRV